LTATDSNLCPEGLAKCLAGLGQLLSQFDSPLPMFQINALSEAIGLHT